eukprot:PITA_31213
MSKSVVTEPSSFEEAVEDPTCVDAMVEEYDSIVKNSSWEIVPRPEGKSMVGLRWIYKVKQAADGSVEKYKAIFIARGFSQIEGIDCEDTFAPVSRYSSIRTILALSAQMGWHIHLMDVKTAFLNGVIEEEVYIEQLEGFEVFSSKSHVCRLKREMYGLKQAPRAWYTRIDSYFTGIGFSKSKDDLAKEFEMKDLGLLYYFLGLEIWQCNGGLFVSQGKYAREILEKFNMHGCKPVDTPLPGGWRKEDATSGEEVDATVYRQLVGSLILGRKPNGQKEHIRRGLQYWINSSFLVQQEAEIRGTQFSRGRVYGSKFGCKRGSNPVFHDRSKHINIRYHHIRDCVQRRIMLLSYIPTEDQDANILTKALTKSKFKYHRGRIGVVDNAYLVEREC